MGLDQYLHRKTYVKKWDHEKPEKQYDVIVRMNGSATHIQEDRISEISEQVAYWRKANQIHQWFVENVQGGNDDCKEYDVSREKLIELNELCKTVLAQSALIDGKIKNGETWENGGWKPILIDGKKIENEFVASKLLPTKNGFFFGGTDYDEYYISDLKYTVETLTKLLSEPDKGDFYYDSSW